MRHVFSFRSLMQSLTRSTRRDRRITRPTFTPKMESLEDLTLPSTISWINPEGGDWAVASNWSGGAVPGPNDDALINLPGNYTVTHLTGNNQVGSLTTYRGFRMSSGMLHTRNPSHFYGALLVNGGVLSGSSQVTVHSTLELFGGMIQGAGDMEIRGLMTWSGGLIARSGQTNTREGIRFTFTGNNGLDYGTLNNYGRVDWTGTGNLILRNGAVFNNMPGSVFLVHNRATFLGDSEVRGGVFNNQGIFRVDAGAANFLRLANHAGVVFNNFHQVHLNGGSMTLARGGNNAGLVHAAFGQSLFLTGETLNVNTNSVFTGEGWVRVQGATVNVNASVHVRNLDNHGVVHVRTGTFRMDNGTATGSFVVEGTLHVTPPTNSAYTFQSPSSIGGAGTVIFAGGGMDNPDLYNVRVDGAYSLTGHTQVVSGSVRVRTSASTRMLTVQDGHFHLGGHLTINGLFTWTGGALHATSQVYANGGMSLSGAADKIFHTGTLTHTGTAIWTGGGTFAFEGGGRFVNRPGSTFHAQNDAMIAFSGAFGEFENYGTILKSVSAGTTVVSGVITNQGTIAINTGRLENYGGIDNRASITVAAGTTLAVDSLISATTAQLTGAGHVQFANFTSLVDGVYNITGQTHVTGAVAFLGSVRTGSLRNQGVAYFGPASTVEVVGDYIQEPEAATQLDGGTITVGGQMRLQGGVTLAWGTINGHVHNAGRLIIGDAGVAGYLRINGDYTQTDTANLDIEIGGIEAGFSYDQFEVSGRATLAGNLNIMLLEGFSANLDDSFHILTWGERVDEFTQINGLDLGDGYHFQPTYDANGFDLWTFQE